MLFRFATFRERNGEIFTDWPAPQAVLVVTGELDGYIEPCGCTGKENQKGGLSRRQNFLRAVASAGWPLVAVDVGNQVKRFGRQTEAKFQSIVDGLRAMGYAGVGFGPAALRLPAEELIAAVAAVGDGRDTPDIGDDSREHGRYLRRPGVGFHHIVAELDDAEPLPAGGLGQAIDADRRRGRHPVEIGRAHV